MRFDDNKYGVFMIVNTNTFEVDHYEAGTKDTMADMEKMYFNCKAIEIARMTHKDGYRILTMADKSINDTSRDYIEENKKYIGQLDDALKRQNEYNKDLKKKKQLYNMIQEMESSAPTTNPAVTTYVEATKYPGCLSNGPRPESRHEFALPDESNHCMEQEPDKCDSCIYNNAAYCQPAECKCNHCRYSKDCPAAYQMPCRTMTEQHNMEVLISKSMDKEERRAKRRARKLIKEQRKGCISSAERQDILIDVAICLWILTPCILGIGIAIGSILTTIVGALLIVVSTFFTGSIMTD